MYFWKSHRESRPAFPTIGHRWDFSKAQSQQLSFTHGVTGDLTRSLRNLEFEAEELQSLAESSGNQGHLDYLKRKKAALANLLSVTAQGALVIFRLINLA